jgi:hypothetical protein
MTKAQGWLHRLGAPLAAAVLAGACGSGVIHGRADGDVNDDAAVLPDGQAPHPDGGGDPDAGDPPDGAVPPDGQAPGPDAAPGPPVNRFGIGLVGPGDANQWNLTADLVGHGGHIKLIFPGIDLNTTGPDGSWVTAVQESYNRELVPVIRLGPHWGDRHIRNMADDASRTTYTQIAQRYAQVVAGLPLRAGWPLYLEVHNEPNLCYEWECHPGEAPAHVNTPAGWMHYSDTAHEYAYFLRDVADALHALGDPRIQVLNGALAPGGAVTCECDGGGYTAGITALEFIDEMDNAVPGIWSRLDGWASHAYPAEGLGWGFFMAYSQSMPGLLFFEHELTAIGTTLPVFITETGWTTDAGAFGSRTDIATWTVDAYNNPWLTHPDIAAVMPFMLQDAAWEAFAWVASGGAPYAVYDAVRAHRCSLGYAGNCP